MPASVVTRRASGSIAVIVSCRKRTPGFTYSRYGSRTASGAASRNITSSLEYPKTNESPLSISVTSTSSPSAIRQRRAELEAAEARSQHQYSVVMATIVAQPLAR